MHEDVVGYLMAWLPKGGDSFNFDFFGAKGSWETSVGENEWRTMGALEYADWYMGELKAGRDLKYGLEVVDGYIQPVMARAKP